MSHIQYLDDLVKEYLLFRGFGQTLKTFDSDLKVDKDKGFRVDRLVDQIMTHIQTFDLTGLRELWNHLDHRIFSHLQHSLLPCVRKLETSILRLYVINTVQSSKPDKLNEFFEKMAPELQNQTEWKDWFCLPYLKAVEENPTYAMYFTRQWQDTLMVSLHNFLAVVFQSLELPTLASYREEASKMTRLLEENELLRARLAALTIGDQSSVLLDDIPVPDAPPPPHIMDDFYNIAQETPSSEGQLKSLKSLLFSLGGGIPTSPILGRRSTTASASPNTAANNTGGSGNSTAHPGVRRTASQAPAEDKRRIRSSSVAGTSRTGVDHAPVKRLAYGSVSTSRQSRSPTKSRPGEETGVVSSSLSLGNSSAEAAPDKTPFLLLGQEEYLEHRATVTHAIYNPSGSLVASADVDGVIKVWTADPSPRTQCGIMVKSAVSALEWLPRSERFLVVGTKAATVRLFDTKDKKTVWELGPDSSSVLKDQRIMTLRCGPSESHLIASVAPRIRAQGTNASTPALHTIDIKSLKVESSYRMEGGVVNGCTLNHNGSLLVCGCNDGTVRIVDLRCPDIIASWLAHQGEVFTVRLSPQENNIYTIGSDNRFACWNMARTGAKVMDYSLHDRAAGPFLVGVGASGGAVVGGSSAAGGGGGRSVLLRPYGSLFTLHQDGEHLLTCSTTGPLIYKLGESTLEQVLPIGGHRTPVLTVDWSNALQCGSCVSASLDGKIRVSTLLPQ